MQQAVACTVVEDVHQPTFDLAQVKAAQVAQPADDDDDGYAPATHAPAKHTDAAGASSLFLAAGALMASLALFL